MHPRLDSILLALVLCVTSVSAARAQGLSSTHGAAIKDSVTAMLERFSRFSASAQWDSLAAMYDDGPDFRWVENGAVRYKSAGQIRQALTALAPSIRLETKYSGIEVLHLGPGLASVLTQFETTFVTPGQPNYSFGGVITMTVGNRGGTWRILSGHTSSSPQSANRR